MDTKHFYEERAKIYTTPDKQGLSRYRRALRLANIRHQSNILDVGCKHAFLADLLDADNIECDYHGLDISENVISRLRNKRGNYQVCDVMKGLPFDDATFDYAFCLELIEHVDHPVSLLIELKRVLKNSGILLLSTPNPYNWLYVLAEILRIPDREGHMQSFTFQNILRLVDFCGLKIENRIGSYAIIPYAPHGIVRGRYLLFPTNLTLLATSFIYRIAKRKGLQTVP